MGKIKVTANLYRTIKALSEDPRRDQMLSKRFKVSLSTIRTIRNTKNYKAYQDRLAKYNLAKKEKMLKEKAAHLKKMEQVLYRRTPADIEREDRAGARMVGLVGMFALLGIVVGMLWLIGWLIAGCAK